MYKATIEMVDKFTILSAPVTKASCHFAQLTNFTKSLQPIWNTSQALKVAKIHNLYHLSPQTD